MASDSPFRLEKLRIEAYARPLRTGPPQKTVTVMFNPESYTLTHVNRLEESQGLDTSGGSGRFIHACSKKLRLDLVLDGTGVSDYGGLRPSGPGPASVARQVDDFLETCFYMDGKLHAPKYLKIHWGRGSLQNFECRLKSVQITYTAFDRSGDPLRAKLETTFLEHHAPKIRVAREGKSSPDLTHHRVVREGDTLPLLCREIYGSPSHYLEVAVANGLDDFRDLAPGQEIVFPPLASGADTSAPNPGSGSLP